MVNTILHVSCDGRLLSLAKNTFRFLYDICKFFDTKRFSFTVHIYTLFYQYIVHCLRFNLECTEKDVTSVDITVSVGLIGESDTDDNAGSTIEGSVQSFGIQQDVMKIGTIDIQGLITGQDTSGNQQNVDKNLKSKIKLEELNDIPLRYLQHTTSE